MKETKHKLGITEGKAIQLGAEAMNVFSETGLTPSELLKQRDELLDILISFKETYEKYGIGGGGKELYDMCLKLSIEAIQKATK